MTPEGVGHVGIQVGGTKPGDPGGVYRSVHPTLPVFGPFIFYPMPLAKATSWVEDAQSEAKSPNQELRLPDVVFHSNNLDTTAMNSVLDVESHERHRKYQLVPGLHPWRFFRRAAEDVTYQPTERLSFWKPISETKVHNCATFVAEVLGAGGVQLQQTRYPWKMSPNSVMQQLSRDEKFRPVDLHVENNSGPPCS
jgi:hypothetical protein